MRLMGGIRGGCIVLCKLGGVFWCFLFRVCIC